MQLSRMQDIGGARGTLTIDENSGVRLATQERSPASSLLCSAFGN